MLILQDFGPAILAMGFLAIGSAFFSCSEAALFSLQAEDRRVLKKGTTAQRLAIELLNHSEQLLIAILFWNLIINILFFSLASVIGIRLEREDRHAEAGLVTFGSLLLIILCSEMAPKTLGVLAPRLMARVVSVPLSVAVRIFRPLAPLFTVVNAALRRLLFPRFRVEPYLELNDLEQAISVSTVNEELAAQERITLQNIVLLSDLHAEELMRPRTQCRTFTPPVHLEDLEGQSPPSGYLLVTEADSDEIAAAIPLNLLPTIPRQHLENFSRPVVYVPWCATVAEVFEELRTEEREVAAVINEFGETIGIVTLDDLLHTVFEDQASRSARLLNTASIHQVGENLWQLTGMTSLRRIGRTFHLALPRTKSMTVAGILQELLQKIPEPGDEVEWYPFHFRVISSDDQGNQTILMEVLTPKEVES